MGISVEYIARIRMKCLLILASVVVAAVGQGDYPEALEARAPTPGGGFPGGNYDPCKCQCVFPAVTDSCPGQSASGLCGNCLSIYNGRTWCYVDGAAANSCSDTKQSSGRFWSYEACITPHVGSSSCPYDYSDY